MKMKKQKKEKMSKRTELELTLFQQEGLWNMGSKLDMNGSKEG